MYQKQMKRRDQRELRTRKKLMSRGNRRRLSVFRSSKYIYAQIVDDDKGETLAAASEREIKLTKDGKRLGGAGATGELLAKRAIKKKIKEVMFDRGRYKYHGQVKALAEGARKGGLKF